MKVFRAAAMLSLLLAGPALAQANKPPPPAQDPPKSSGEIESDNAKASAYKRSLGNIPDKPPADPWGGARAIEPPKAATTTPPPAKRTKASTNSTAN